MSQKKKKEDFFTRIVYKWKNQGVYHKGFSRPPQKLRKKEPPVPR